MAQLQFCPSMLDGEVIGGYEAAVMDAELLDDGDGLILPAEEVMDEYEEWAAAGPSLSIDYVANRSVDRAALEADAKLSAVVESVASTASFLQCNNEEEAGHAMPNGTYEEVVEAQTSRRKKATIVRCQYCGVVLKHPSKIQAHMRTHTGEKPFECNICGMRFTQRTPMRMHVRRHVGDTPFACSWGCGKSFVSNALKNAHEVRIHLGEKRQGPPCPHLKPPRRSVPLPPLQDQPPPMPEGGRSAILDFQPPVGEIKQSLSASANKKLDEVIEAVAAGIPLPPPRQARRRPALVAQCQECGLLLKHPSKIQAHLRTHTGERPFQCGVCGMRFATANPLRVHLRRAHTGEKPYECTWDCGRRFVSASARNEHERIVHAGIKRYQCTVGTCRRLFTRRRYLMLHQEKEHLEAERQADNAIECVLDMVEREIHSAGKSSNEASMWMPQKENEEGFKGEGGESNPVKLIGENGDEIVDEVNGLDEDMLVYTEGFEESIDDIVLEEGPLEIHGEVQSAGSQTVNAQQDQHLRIINEQFHPSADLFEELPSEIYLFDGEYVVVDEACLGTQQPEPELEFEDGCLEESDDHLVETRSFWLPSTGQSSRLGRVRIIKPKSSITKREDP